MAQGERDILERAVLVISEQAASASGVIDEAMDAGLTADHPSHGRGEAGAASGRQFGAQTGRTLDRVTREEPRSTIQAGKGGPEDSAVPPKVCELWVPRGA